MTLNTKRLNVSLLLVKSFHEMTVPTFSVFVVAYASALSAFFDCDYVTECNVDICMSMKLH